MSDDNIDRIASAVGACAEALITTAIVVVVTLVMGGDGWHVPTATFFIFVAMGAYNRLRLRTTVQRYVESIRVLLPKKAA